MADCPVTNVTTVTSIHQSSALSFVFNVYRHQKRTATATMEIVQQATIVANSRLPFSFNCIFSSSRGDSNFARNKFIMFVFPANKSEILVGKVELLSH